MGFSDVLQVLLGGASGAADRYVSDLDMKKKREDDMAKLVQEKAIAAENAKAMREQAVNDDIIKGIALKQISAQLTPNKYNPSPNFGQDLSGLDPSLSTSDLISKVGAIFKQAPRPVVKRSGGGGGGGFKPPTPVTPQGNVIDLSKFTRK